MRPYHPRRLGTLESLPQVVKAKHHGRLDPRAHPNSTNTGGGVELEATQRLFHIPEATKRGAITKLYVPKGPMNISVPLQLEAVRRAAT